MDDRHPAAFRRTCACALLALLSLQAIGARAQSTVTPPPPAEVESRLQSLRRSVENTTDIKSILSRYARFIEQYKDSAAAKEAERDAATWRERLEKGMVKVGARWVTPAEREALRLQARATAEKARQALLNTRTLDADALVRQALEEDPADLVANYLSGVLLFNQNQFVASRKCFEAVAAGLPHEGPTLNNLAIVQWRLNQTALAMKYYEQAMAALPVNKELLHNVSEAINALPAGQRKTPVALNAIRLFDAQQAELAKKLEKEGLAPWGSQWVDKATVPQLQATEKEIEQKLAELSADYDKNQKAIDEIDGTLESDAKQMKIMETASNARDLRGFQIQRPLPARYFELQRQSEKLAQDRIPLVAKQADDRAQAEKELHRMPIQKFTAVQRLFGAEGTPKPPTPTTHPSTQPAR